jgi:iron uptake system EfeUOB component EfeO/EfeM
MKKNFTLVLIATSLFITVACSPKQEAKKEVSPFKPTASIQELMISIVDPNVDPIWDSIQTISTAAGVEEKHPKTDEEWTVLKNHAIALREVTNLLLIEGRKVAASNTSTVAAELSPDEIEKLIAANRPAFIKNAHDLHEAVTQAIVAIDAKDVAALEATGSLIDEACEKCHMQFWYPGDKRPTK